MVTRSRGLFVIVSHTLRAAEVGYGTGDVGSKFLPLNLLDLGTFGVCLFFALSGCTLYVANASKVKAVCDIPHFYLKRILRIWPAFAISMIVFVVFTKVFISLYTGDRSLWIGQFETPYSIGDVFRYLFLVSDMTGPRTIINGAYWSLPIEFRYYLLLPIVFLLIRTRVIGIAAALLISVLLYDVLYHQSSIPMNRYEFFQLGFTFFGGVVIAALFHSVSWRIRFLYSLVLFAVCIAVASALRWDYIPMPKTGFFSDILNCYGVIAVVCVFLVMYAKPISVETWFTNRLYNYGLVSYSIYLYHMLFVGIAVIMVVRFDIYGSYEKLAFIFLLTFFGSYCTAIIGYRFVERPFIELGKGKRTRSIPYPEATN